MGEGGNDVCVCVCMCAKRRMKITIRKEGRMLWIDLQCWIEEVFVSSEGDEHDYQRRDCRKKGILKQTWSQICVRLMVVMGGRVFACNLLLQVREQQSCNWHGSVAEF